MRDDLMAAPPSPASRRPFWGLLFPGLLFSLLTLVWLIGYASMVARAGDFLRRPRIRCFVARVTGSVLIALGLRLVREL
jgi:threonine/homoserine/homoserine lactone efflux protein